MVTVNKLSECVGGVCGNGNRIATHANNSVMHFLSRKKNPKLILFSQSPPWKISVSISGMLSLTRKFLYPDSDARDYREIFVTGKVFQLVNTTQLKKKEDVDISPTSYVPNLHKFLKFSWYRIKASILVVRLLFLSVTHLSSSNWWSHDFSCSSSSDMLVK